MPSVLARPNTRMSMSRARSTPLAASRPSTESAHSSVSALSGCGSWWRYRYGSSGAAMEGSGGVDVMTTHLVSLVHARGTQVVVETSLVRLVGPVGPLAPEGVVVVS